MDVQHQPPPPLFRPTKDTSTLAGATAAKLVGSRRERILQALRTHGPLALFEIAAIMEVGDHHISGRFTELERDGLIHRTGQRRTKPDTGCDAELWDLAPAVTPPAPDAQELLLDKLGYPREVRIDGDSFDRSSEESQFPGIPYQHRRSGVVYWLTLLESPCCGRPMRSSPTTTAHKRLACLRCNKEFEVLPLATGALALFTRTL